MSSFRSKVKKIKALSPNIEVTEEKGCIVLRGEVDQWETVVKAGRLAVDRKKYYGVINDIRLKGYQPKEKLPSEKDNLYDGEKPDVLIIGGGLTMVIYLAALQDVPRTLYEAAEIDGANALKRFFYITLPGISPAIFFQLIMGIINNFQYFTQAYLMIGSSTGGGLNVVSGGAENSLLFYALYLYQNAFNLFKMGKASAMAWILFVVVAVVTAVVFKTQDRWVSYGEE